MMTRSQLWVLLSLLILPPTGIILYSAVATYLKSDEGEAEKYHKLRWQDLKQLDVRNNYVPPALATLNNTRVMIPGFVVPLEDEDTKLAEFLLVPSPQACIHVPPPPPNQMILVKMDPNHSPKRSWGAVWLKGRLQISSSETQYGKISYRLYGEGAEVYRD
jgi:uncharacterized protein